MFKKLLAFMAGLSILPVYAFTVYLDSTKYEGVTSVRVEDSPPPPPPGTSPGMPTPTPAPPAGDCSGSLQLVNKGDLKFGQNRDQIKNGQVNAWRVAGPHAVHLSSDAGIKATVQTSTTTHTGTGLNSYWATLSDCPGEIVNQAGVCSQKVVQAASLRLMWESGGVRSDDFYCPLVNDGRAYYINITPVSNGCRSGAWCGYLLTN